MVIRRDFLNSICTDLLGVVALLAVGGLTGAHAQEGQATYEKTCIACHAKGVSGAPRSDDGPAWQARLARNGYSGLFDSAIKGRGAMPPRGGNAALGDDEVMSAVMHILRVAASGTASTPIPPAAKTVPAAPAVADGSGGKGRTLYQSACAACHATGAAGAPKFGDAAAWGPRIASGISSLHNSALKGKGAMPAKGGNAALPDADVKAAVDFMVLQSRSGGNIAAAKLEAKKAVSAVAIESPGKSVYQATCSACHATGIAGAPKVGDQAAWALRIKSGNAALYGSAMKGKGAMPPKGGNAALPDDDIKAAVDFMLAQVGGAANPGAGTSAKPMESAAAAPPVSRVTDTPASANTSAAPTPVPAATGVNTFNRLLQAPGKRNLPPMEDGIHDAGNEATDLLQAPLNAYAGWPKSNAGNRIDWVKALNEKNLVPRADKQDQKAEMAVLDLNIVREVKGSMPDVVYPHRQHTQWLDCSNCHPAIFIPQKGANQMSMASIILGQKCGVCHGKVAFPISECRMCHSKAKEPASVAAGAAP